MDCIFCKIIKGEIPSYKIYEDENVYAFLDIAGDVDGHTLVIPKKHYESMIDCDEKTYKNVLLAVQKIAKHYVNDCGYKGVNIFNANDKCAQQSVFHFHVHIVPRKENDGIDGFPHFSGAKEKIEDIHKKLELKNA